MAHPVHFNPRGMGNVPSKGRLTLTTCTKCGWKWVPRKDVKGFTCSKCGTRVVIRK